jgi:hypothetical protein
MQKAMPVLLLGGLLLLGGCGERTSVKPEAFSPMLRKPQVTPIYSCQQDGGVGACKVAVKIISGCNITSSTWCELEVDHDVVYIVGVGGHHNTKIQFRIDDAATKNDYEFDANPIEFPTGYGTCTPGKYVTNCESGDIAQSVIKYTIRLKKSNASATIAIPLPLDPFVLNN